MRHAEGKKCLKRLSVPRVTYIYDICTNILNGIVSLESTYIYTICRYGNTSTKSALKKCSLKTDKKHLASNHGIDMINMFLLKVSS